MQVKEMFNTKLSREVNLYSPELQVLKQTPDQRDPNFIDHFTVPTRQNFTEFKFHYDVERSWLLGTTEISVKCPSNFL